MMKSECEIVLKLINLHQKFHYDSADSMVDRTFESRMVQV